MEIFRSLAALVETPHPDLEAQSEILGLGPLPTRSAHTELFELQLVPVASIYLGAEGKLGGEARDRVAGFWRALGQQPPQEPDHLATLLATYAQLVERSVDRRIPARDQESWQRARWSFLWEHLISWLPVFLTRLADLDSGFYRRWAQQLQRALHEELQQAPRPSELPLHLRTAPRLTDPRTADASEFLDRLLAPVQTGMILSRTSLSELAVREGLGLRIGDRRRSLEALLGQNAAGTLAGLQGLATRAGAEHQGLDPATEPVRSFWSERALTTASLLGELASEARAATP